MVLWQPWHFVRRGQIRPQITIRWPRRHHVAAAVNMRGACWWWLEVASDCAVGEVDIIGLNFQPLLGAEATRRLPTASSQAAPSNRRRVLLLKIHALIPLPIILRRPRHLLRLVSPRLLGALLLARDVQGYLLVCKLLQSCRGTGTLVNGGRSIAKIKCAVRGLCLRHGGTF